MAVAPPAPIHWTTYIQTVAVIGSTIGTFVYVYFTYHIMKWAVGQGRAAIRAAEVTVEDARLKRELWLRQCVEITGRSGTAVAATRRALGNAYTDYEILVALNGARLSIVSLRDKFRLFNQESEMPASILDVMGEVLPASQRCLQGLDQTPHSANPQIARTAALEFIDLLVAEIANAYKAYRRLLLSNQTEGAG